MDFYTWKMKHFYYSGRPGYPSVDFWLSYDPGDFTHYNTRMLEERFRKECAILQQ